MITQQILQKLVYEKFYVHETAAENLSKFREIKCKENM